MTERQHDQPSNSRWFSFARELCSVSFCHDRRWGQIIQEPPFDQTSLKIKTTEQRGGADLANLNSGLKVCQNLRHTTPFSWR
jgi:hypothetical protein